MSTIKVNNVNPPNAGEGVKIDGLQMPTAGALTGRRLNINGAMQVSQRGTSFNVAHDDATAPYTLDRYRFISANLDSYDCTVIQSDDAPSGFAKSLKVTTGTTDAVNADDLFYLMYAFEGQDVQMLQNGTAGAKKVTVSFYVKTSQPGTYGVNFYKINATARGISKTYTTTTTDWEYVELTFDGDTGGSGINNDTSEGLRFSWTLIAGSDWTSTDSTSWADYASTGWAYGHTQNGMATNASATWQLSGVQIEVGEKATEFEHRPLSTELDLCKRYFQTSYGYGVGIGASTYSGGSIYRGNTATTVTPYVPFRFMREMRAIPTITLYSPGTGTSGKVGAGTGNGGADEDWDGGASSIGRQSFMYYNNGVLNANNVRVYPTVAYYHLYAHYTAEAEI